MQIARRGRRPATESTPHGGLSRARGSATGARERPGGARTRYDGGVAVIRYARLGDEDEIVELGTSTYAESFRELWSPAGLAEYLAGQFSIEQIRRELAEGDAIRYVVAQREGEL